MSEKKKPRRWLRRVVLGLAFLLSIGLVAASIYLRLYFYGPRLAARITSLVNGKIRGRVEVGSITWSVRDLHTFVTGGTIGADLHNVKVYDFEGNKVVDVPHLHADLYGRTALLRGDLVIEHVEVEEGWALLKEVTEPYPMYNGDIWVASIVSAFYPRSLAEKKASEASTKAGPLISIRSADLRNVDLEFQYEAFTSKIEKMNGRGDLSFDLRDPAEPRGIFVFHVDGGAPRGKVTVGETEVQLEQIRLTELEQGKDRARPYDIQWVAGATTPEGAAISIVGNDGGGLVGYWKQRWNSTLETTVTVTNAGPLLSRLTERYVEGTDVRIALTTRGPRLEPTLGVVVSGLDATVPMGAKQPPLDLHVPTATATLDVKDLTGKATMTLIGGGGEVQLNTAYGLDPPSFNAYVLIPKEIRLARQLPEPVVELIGSDLRGTLHAYSIKGGGIDIDDIDLWLGRAHLSGALRRTDQNVLVARPLAITAGETRLEARGNIDLGKGRLDRLRVSVESGDVADWLARLGFMPIARKADGTLVIDGPFDDPRATADVNVAGLPVVDQAHATLEYQDQVLTFDQVSAQPLGGALRGHARLRLGARPHIESASIEGAGIELDKVPGVGGLLAGLGRFQARASGPLSNPELHAEANAEPLVLRGDRYPQATLRADRNADGTISLAVHLGRQRGGELDVQGTLGKRGQLDGVVSLRALPVDSLPGIVDEAGQPMAGGVVDAELRLSGTTSAPTADGNVTLAKAWFKDAFLGSASLELERVGEGKVRVRGSLFQGRLRLDAEVDTRRWRSSVELAFTRVELDQFLPELSARWEARGWASGKVKAEVDLVTGEVAQAHVDISEAVVLVDDDDLQGRPRPIEIRTMTPLAVAWDGKVATLEHEVVLRGPTGDFTLSGSAALDKLALHVVGEVDARLFAQYVRQYVAEPEGKLAVNVDLAGTVTDWKVTGVLEIAEGGISMRPISQEAILRIPAGKIEVTNDALSITGLSVQVTDEVTGEEAELTVGGGVKLDDFVPVSYALNIDGQLAGRMLMVAMPDAFATASGWAQVQVGIGGTGEQPDIEGEIVFSPPDDNQGRPPLTFTPRGLRREIVLDGGTVSFTKELIAIDENEPIHGRIDDAGELSSLSGEISLRDWKPVDIDLFISADAVPFTVPGQLDLDLSLDQVRLVGSETEGFDLTGNITIVDGRYSRNVKLWPDTLEPERVSESSESLAESAPLLAGMRLRLDVTTDAFFVRNNIADLELDGAVTITGTPERPRINGEVRVEQGGFDIPGFRASFTRTTGTIQFSDLRVFPEETPVIALSSEADYRDTRGENHQIFMTMNGTLTSLNWGLSTNTGLNKQQTLALITTGRSLEQNRQALEGGSAPGSQVDSTGQTTDESAFYDQFVKDFAGDMISILIGDPIRNATKLDVLRIEPSTAGVTFYGEKQLDRSKQLSGGYDLKFRGASWFGKFQYRMTDRWSLDAEARSRTVEDHPEQDEDTKRIKVNFRFIIP